MSGRMTSAQPEHALPYSGVDRKFPCEPDCPRQPLPTWPPVFLSATVPADDADRARYADRAAPLRAVPAGLRGRPDVVLSGRLGVVPAVPDDPAPQPPHDGPGPQPLLSFCSPSGGG